MFNFVLLCSCHVFTAVVRAIIVSVKAGKAEGLIYGILTSKIYIFFEFRSLILQSRYFYLTIIEIVCY